MTTGDITYNKHGGNAASEAAYRRGHDRYEVAREILVSLIECAPDGMTSKEISERTGWAMHTFSGRLSELKAAGRIRARGSTRRGAAVLEVVPAALGEQARLFGEGVWK